MSQNMLGGELELNGYAFYLNGCGGDSTVGADRPFECAYFTIDTSAATAVPEPFTLSLFGAGFAGAVAMRRRKKKPA